MGLERRKNGLYYYRSTRVGKRVVKEYFGGGPGAVLIDRLERLKAQKREFDRWEQRDRSDGRRRRLARLSKLFVRVNGRVGEALRAAGWHQHKREWRKRRGTTMAANLATLIDTWVMSDLRTKAGTLDPEVQAKWRRGTGRSCWRSTSTSTTRLPRPSGATPGVRSWGAGSNGSQEPIS